MEKEDSGYFFTLFQWVGIFLRHNVCEMRENSIWIYQLYFAISAAFFSGTLKETIRQERYYIFFMWKLKPGIV